MSEVSAKNHPEMCLFIKRPGGKPFFSCYESKKITRLHFDKVTSGIHKDWLDTIFPEGSEIEAKFLNGKVSIRFHLPHACVNACIIPVGSETTVEIMGHEFVFYVRECTY